MKFYEAESKMRAGDVFRPDDSRYAGFKLQADGFFVSDEGGTKLNFCRKFFSLEGEIIPAEPKVLTAEDMLFHRDDFDMRCDKDRIRYGEAMHKNGRLEMWLEFKNLADENAVPKLNWLQHAIEKLKP